MNIITIFNYPLKNENYTKMCLIWLNQIKKYGKGFNVKIFTENGVNDTVKKTIDEFEFNLVNLKRKELGYKNNKFSHNIGFKLYNLCNETEPFIFIDADAFVLRDLNDLVNKCENQRFVCVNHEKIPGHTTQFNYEFLNSGVQICNDPSILDFEKIIKCKMISPGSDQSMLFTYFNNIGYDYTNKNVGFEWNSYARYVKLEKNKEDDWIGISKGLNFEHPVYINHYWYDAKPWDINCKLFKDYEKKFEGIFV